MQFSGHCWQVMERLILGPGSRQGVSILIFHRVREDRDPLRPNEPTRSEFDNLIRFLAENFHVASLQDAVSGLTDPGRKYHSVVVTFDDGYADNAEVALPILKKYGVPATFFIASGLLDGGMMWNDRIIEAVRVATGPVLQLSGVGLGELSIAETSDRRASIRSIIQELKYRPDSERIELANAVAEMAGGDVGANLMMSSEQVQELAREPLAEIGGHTVTHPILKDLPAQRAYQEIADGKERLEALTGRKLTSFAYPNGIPGRDYVHDHVEMVRKAGFDLAVSTSAGGASLRSDVLQLPRFTPWDRQWLRFGLRMLAVARKTGKTTSKQ